MLIRRSTRRSLAAVLVALCSLLGASRVATAQTQTAVEYYYSAWNFYFVTSFPAEIAALDEGAFGGVWQRTGQTFDVWTGPTNGALPTCRFFSTVFAPKSSHFYTPYANECSGLMAPTSGWQFEAIAFYLQLPDGNGNCPAGTTILYRLYNNGMGGAPNHRFTTSTQTFNLMQSLGWVFEGDGRTGAFACVPVTVIPAGTAEGLWNGVATNGSSVTNIVGVILDNGTYYFLYTVPGKTSVAGVVQGTSTSVNGQFASSDARDFSIIGFGVTPAAIAGMYTVHATLSGIITKSGGSSTFAATYNATYDQPASPAAAAGTYSGSAASSVGIAPVVLTVNSDGVIFGAGPGCTFSGVATPRGTVNIFDLSVTFQGGGCVFGTNTLVGVAYYDATGHTIYATAPNAARTDGFLFIGSKP